VTGVSADTSPRHSDISVTPHPVNNETLPSRAHKEADDAPAKQHAFQRLLWNLPSNRQTHVPCNGCTERGDGRGLVPASGSDGSGDGESGIPACHRGERSVRISRCFGMRDLRSSPSPLPDLRLPEALPHRSPAGPGQSRETGAVFPGRASEGNASKNAKSSSRNQGREWGRCPRLRRTPGSGFVCALTSSLRRSRRVRRLESRS
jgi:hypothetical protein